MASSRSAQVALAAGAAGAVACTFYAGWRLGSPLVVLLLFAAWVGFPFVVLASALRASRGRAALVHQALSRAALIVSPVSVVGYVLAGAVPARPIVPLFVLVAPAALLVVGVAVASAVLAGSRSR